jgi:hypothetical protein
VLSSTLPRCIASTAADEKYVRGRQNLKNHLVPNFEEDPQAIRLNQEELNQEEGVHSQFCCYPKLFCQFARKKNLPHRPRLKKKPREGNSNSSRFLTAHSPSPRTHSTSHPLVSFQPILHCWLMLLFSWSWRSWPRPLWPSNLPPELH